MDKRRTNPGFLSDDEAARDRERTKIMVRGIINGKQDTRISETNSFVADPRFWGSWRGRIIRAIVLNGANTRNAILKATKLKEEELEQALKELFQANLLEEREQGKFWVNRELYGKCKSYFEELQETLIDWVQKWRRQERVESILDHKLSHFYLANRLLSKFSESLIEQAKQEILVTNPFVKRCHISDALILMSEKGINVKLVTRSIEPEQFKRELFAKGVAITYDESIHAKLIVVDRRVGIVSSMNFYAGSSGGACWEAGIATIARSVVNSITRSILSKM